MKLPINYDRASREERRAARVEYERAQGGNCCYCGKPLDRPSPERRWHNAKLFPSNFLRWPVHLHHDHKTGLTIGAIHARCNGASWQYDRV